jgi:large subunit ribosomal protein L29
MNERHAKAFRAKVRAMAPADMQKELLELRREQFNLRMTRATGQSVKPDQFTKVRRNIARLKTVLGEQKRPEQKTKSK